MALYGCCLREQMNTLMLLYQFNIERTHRVVLHMVKAPLPVERDCDRGADRKRRRDRVQDSAASVSLHVFYAYGRAIFSCEGAAVGWLTAA